MGIIALASYAVPPRPALAVKGKVAVSTQNQALSALLFLYREVLSVDLPWLDSLVRAKPPQRLPVVLTREEVRTVLGKLDGVSRLMAFLLYGAGLRLLEWCRLRVTDVDFGTNLITIRDGKGGKDRVTMLPAAIKADLATHIERVRQQHQADLHRGAGWVEFPWALARKYPNVSPLFRHPPAGGQPRHTHRAGTPRPSRLEHHTDLHSRPEPGSGRRQEAGRSDVPVMRWPYVIRFHARADVLNREATRDNTKSAGRDRRRRRDNSERSRPTPAPGTGVEQTDYHGVTRFQ